MLALLTSLALAGAPSMTCESVEVAVPAEQDADTHPKGFQWEGFVPAGVLTDGRTVLVRGSALEGLSRKALKRQHEEGGPDRVMQVVFVTPAGKLDKVAQVPRGTLLEIAGTPDGGALVARALDAVSVIDLIESNGSSAGLTRTPENPKFDKTWRRENPVRGTGPTRMTPLSEDRVVVWHAGSAVVLDLQTHAVRGAREIWTLGLPTVFNRRGAGELLVVDRARKLSWLDDDLQPLRTEDCADCRVVGLQQVVSGDKARPPKWKPTARPRRAAILKPEGEDLHIVWAGDAAETDKEAPEPVVLSGVIGGPWRARTGPWGAALISTELAGEHHVSAVRPGQADTWTWTAPDGLVRDGEFLVADALGPYIRLRVASGDGAEERTRLAGLADPTTGAVTDLVEVAAQDPALGAMLGNPWHVATFADGSMVRVDGDPEMARMPPGATTAAFERCRIDQP